MRMDRQVLFLRSKSSGMWQCEVGSVVPDVCKVLKVRQTKKSDLLDPEDEGTMILQNVRKCFQMRQNHILEGLVLHSATVRT
jgi:hypothetical protein